MDWLELVKAKTSDRFVEECGSDFTNIHEQINQIVLIPLTIFIVFFNVVILTFFAMDRKFHTKMYALIAILGFADLFVGAVCIGTLITEAGERTLEQCLVRMGFTISACVSSMFCLMAIAIERYVAISWPFTYEKVISRMRVGIAVVMLWTLSFTIGFTPLMGLRVETYGKYCSFRFVLPDFYVLLTVVVGMALPTAVMCIIYIKLFRNAHYHIKRIEAVENIAKQQSSFRMFKVLTRKFKSLKTLVIVSGCVVVTWCPFLVATIMSVVHEGRPCSLYNIIGTHLLLLGFSNSFLNPLIYVIRTKDFQSRVKEKLYRRHTWPICKGTSENK